MLHTESNKDTSLRSEYLDIALLILPQNLDEINRNQNPIYIQYHRELGMIGE